MTRYVFSTSQSQVWLVDADDHLEAEESVHEQYENVSEVWFEGTLEEFLTDVDREGITLLNE